MNLVNLAIDYDGYVVKATVHIAADLSSNSNGTGSVWVGDLGIDMLNHLTYT